MSILKNSYDLFVFIAIGYEYEHEDVVLEVNTPFFPCVDYLKMGQPFVLT